MLHKISDMIHVVETMHKKSKQLHSAKYGGFIKTPERDAAIDILIDDIQSLALKIAMDKSHYVKPEDKND